MSRPKYLLSLAAVALALTSISAAPAFAQRDRVRVVDVGDVDTYSDRGADVALRRIERASEHVCAVQGGAQPIPQREWTRDCAAETMENAVADSGNSGLVARYYGYDPQVTVSEGDADDPYYTDKK